MILISALSFILFCLTSLLGYAMLPKTLCFGAQNQAFQIGLGIVSASNLLLMISCFTPVTPWIGISLVLILMLYYLKMNPTLFKRWWLDNKTELPWLLLCAGAGSIVTLLPITWSDTHYYHYPLLKWISTFGILPGIGLIDPTFSHAAGWFALFAPFDTGIFSERLGTAGGALTLGLCLYAICRSSHVLVGLGALGIFFILGLTHNIFASLSPDIMAQWIVLIAISLWILPCSQRLFREQLILILLASGISIRVTLLPVLLLFGFCHLLNQRGRFSSLWILLLLIPPILSTLISSGCPLYPLSWFCVDGGISSSGAKAMQAHIREIVIWCDNPPLEGSGILGWFPSWFYCEYNRIPISFLLLGFLLLPYKKMQTYELQAVLISLVMVIFFFFTAPASRYGAIWFLLPFLIALQLRIKAPTFRPTNAVSFLILILSIYVFWSLPPTHEKNYNHWLIPARAMQFLTPVEPKTFLWHETTINAPWTHNQAPRCSTLTPPCATPESLHNLTPLAPKKVSGFRHRK